MGWIEAQNAQGRGVYFTANLTAPELCKKPTKGDICQVAAVWADLDLRAGEPLEAERERLEALATELHALASPPTLIVDSGNGIQPVWMLADPIEASPESQAAAESLCRQIEHALGGQGTHNVDRVLRTPGTRNYPNARKRKLGRIETEAKLLRWTWQRYRWSDLEALAEQLQRHPPRHAVPLGDQAKATPKAEQLGDIPRVTKALRQRFDATLAKDARLRARWSGEPPGGTDTSRSAFDLSLAHYLREHGYTLDEYAALAITWEHGKGTQGDARHYARCWAKADATTVATCHAPAQPYENAKLFHDAHYGHPERHRLLYQGGEWYHWTGTCWPVLDQGQLRAQLYQHFERCAYADPEKPERGRIQFNPTRRKVDDLLDTLQSLAHVAIATAVPSWLERSADVPADQLVACVNGLLHVPTRTLLPHTPTYYTHHAVPFKFRPEAPAPERWYAFLADLWGDDQESIDTLAEIFGYLVSGDTRQQKLFLMVGPKRSGRGTIARVLKALIGHHHYAGPTLAGMAGAWGLMSLIGKPVAVISDARLGGRTEHSIVTERLLSISGEDTLTVDRKYREPWTGQLPTRIVIISNELPRLTDSSGALASRFVTLMLTRSFYGKENPDLTRQLCLELPGILNWSLNGLERLRERGRFQQPQSSADALRELEDLSSPVGAFVRERCEVGPTCKVVCDHLYQAWRKWCEDRGYDRPGSIQTFARDLRAAMPGIKVRQSRIEGRLRRYAGIALSDDEAE